MRRNKQIICMIWTILLCLFGGIETSAESVLANMSLEQKVAQLFFITPEALTGVSGVVEAGAITEASFQQYPVGGIVYFGQNIQDREQVTTMLENMQQISMKYLGVPIFLAVDEEGGTVTRVYGSGVDHIPYISDMLCIGSTGMDDLAYRVGKKIGNYLSELNFNLDFAPVADIYSNPLNTVIGTRSFGYDAETVSQMVVKAVGGFHAAGMMCTLKHFPGHGDTSQDSHAGYACSDKTLEELRECELVPFQAGIDAGAELVMVGHISLPNILEDDTPSSLSYTIVTELLRGELGFSGVIITDAMNMGAISENYTSGQAAIMAIQAGVDMILMPEDFQSAYEEVLNAVYTGQITEERIDESVKRIMDLKMS